MKRFGYEWMDAIFGFCAFFWAVVAGATPVSAYLWASGLDGCDLQLSAWLILVGFFAALGIFVGLAWFWGLVELGFLRAGEYMLKRSARDEEPCANTKCDFWDLKFDQHCAGEINGGPAVADCKKYRGQM